MRRTVLQDLLPSKWRMQDGRRAQLQRVSTTPLLHLGVLALQDSMRVVQVSGQSVVKVCGQSVVKVCGQSVSLKCVVKVCVVKVCVVQVCGPSVWSKCVVSVWSKCVVKVRGQSVWSKCVVKVRGQSAWSKCVVKVRGQSAWSKCVVESCGRSKKTVKRSRPPPPRGGGGAEVDGACKRGGLDIRPNIGPNERRGRAAERVSWGREGWTGMEGGAACPRSLSSVPWAGRGEQGEAAREGGAGRGGIMKGWGESTSPKTTCLPSRWGVATVVMKNCADDTDAGAGEGGGGGGAVDTDDSATC
jgi:hypothetical protein